MYYICRNKDPLFTLATPLRPHELETFSTKCLSPSKPQSKMDPSPGIVKAESLENIKCCCNENDEIGSFDDVMEKRTSSSPKRPGWFGKGYAKYKRPAKKRRVR